MIFDSHAHYDDKQFAEDRAGLLSSMGKNNIKYIMNVGASLKSSQSSLGLAKEYDFIYASVGVHPSDISELNEEGMSWLWEQTAHPKVKAIGEIGLDYYWEKEETERRKQQEWFKSQLMLAREAGLPVIIHSRDAAADTLQIMKEEAKGLAGVIHCFSYSRELALEYVDMGFYLGVGGVLTFKNAKKLREAVMAIPLERILVETDCPYLAPEPNRGKRNSSLYLPVVISELARIKGVEPKEAERITCENAMRLYQI